MVIHACWWGSTACRNCSLCLDCFVFVDTLAFNVGNNVLEEEVDDLGCYCKVDYLVAEPGRIDFECPGGGCFDLMVGSGKGFGCQTEDVKVGDYDASKGDIDESCEEHGQVRCYEVEDESFFRHGCLVLLVRLPVFKVIQARCNVSQQGGEGRYQCNQQASWEEHLKPISDCRNLGMVDSPNHP